MPIIRSLEACSACKEFVKNELFSPKTADFQSCLSAGYSWEPDEPNRYGIRSFVDSQNLMGAVVRSEYMCYALDDDEWKLDELWFKGFDGEWELDKPGVKGE
jgi:hypothetical protein